LTGREVAVTPAAGHRPGDVRIYLTDPARLHAVSDWRPQRSAADTLADTAAWLRANEAMVLAALG
jgi:nucleoside-diphosphate-sugar epimerase